MGAKVLPGTVTILGPAAQYWVHPRKARSTRTSTSPGGSFKPQTQARSSKLHRNPFEPAIQLFGSRSRASNEFPPTFSVLRSQLRVNLLQLQGQQAPAIHDVLRFNEASSQLLNQCLTFPKLSGIGRSRREIHQSTTSAQLQPKRASFLDVATPVRPCGAPCVARAIRGGWPRAGPS